VERVNSDLVVKNAEGKVYTVRYEAVNTMLLQELKNIVLAPLPIPGVDASAESSFS
jgi:hypothetical protein